MPGEAVDEVVLAAVCLIGDDDDVPAVRKNRVMIAFLFGEEFLGGFCDSSSACLASNASEMYLRKMSPRTTCLYSAASMLLRSASAACQSLASKPTLAAELLGEVLYFTFGKHHLSGNDHALDSISLLSSE